MYYSVCVRIVRAAFTSLKEAVGIDYGQGQDAVSHTELSTDSRPARLEGGRERGGEREKYSTVN